MSTAFAVGGARSLRCIAAACTLLAVMGGARAESAITAYEDDTGAWFVTDGTSGHGRRLLFTVGEYAARSMPPARAQQGACPPIARAAVPDWQIHIEPVAAGLGIDPNLIRAVIWAESRCNPRARSPKGAQGLMQLMPATAREYGVTDAFDPLQNIRAGARYLRDLMGLFSGNLELALAAYNAGPRSVFDARMRIPAFRETRAYVPAVLARVAALGRPAP